MSRSLLRILAVLAAALLLLGACADDDEGAEAPAETAEPDDSTSDDDDEGDDTTTTTTDGEGDEDEDDEGEADDTTTTEATGLDPADMANPASIDDFCGVFEAFTAMEDPFLAGEEAPDPEAEAAALRDAFTMAQALFERAEQLAPSEVEADMALVADGIGVYNEVMAEYDYDFMAVGQASVDDPTVEERLQVLDSVEFTAASDNLEAFVLADCGIDLSAQ